ncbi:MAG: alpha/beta fold hydrolase, partial [Acidimicrobiales bacterium]
ALLLAEIARPGTFAGIYAFEPVVFAPPPSGVLDLSSPLADMTRRRRESFGSREEAHANFLSKPPLSGFDPAALRAYLDHGFEELAGGEVRLRCGRNHEADMYMAGRAHDAWDHLGEIACPVTVAYGERSDFMDAASAGELASRLARGEVELVGGVSHFGPMERPGEVAGSAMAAFATGGPATGRRRVRDSDTPMA